MGQVYNPWAPDSRSFLYMTAAGLCHTPLVGNKYCLGMDRYESAAVWGGIASCEFAYVDCLLPAVLAGGRIREQLSALGAVSSKGRSDQIRTAEIPFCN